MKRSYSSSLSEDINSKGHAMNNRILYLPAIIILLTSPFAVLAQQNAAAVSGEVLTLDQAISLALRDSRQVKNAQLAVGKAGDEVAAARTQRLPSLNVYSLVSQQLLKHDAGRRLRYERRSRRRPDLLNRHRAQADGDLRRSDSPAAVAAAPHPPGDQAGRVSARGGGRETALAEQTTVNQVKQTYYGILQTQSALDSLLEAIRYYRELDRVTADNVAQQVSLKADSLEVKTRLAKTEYEALNLIESTDHSEGAAQQPAGTGRSAPSSGWPRSPMSMASTPTSSWREPARSTSGPNCGRRGCKVRQAELERRIKKSEYIPDVSVGFTYMSFRNFGTDAIPKNSASVGVVDEMGGLRLGQKEEPARGESQDHRADKERACAKPRALS